MSSGAPKAGWYECSELERVGRVSLSDPNWTELSILLPPSPKMLGLQLGATIPDSPVSLVSCKPSGSLGGVNRPAFYRTLHSVPGTVFRLSCVSIKCSELQRGELFFLLHLSLDLVCVSFLSLSENSGSFLTLILQKRNEERVGSENRV